MASAPGFPPVPTGPLSAPAAPTLASSMMTPFADLAAAAGAGPQLTAYLAARNLHRTATLALIATALPEFEDRVVRPFLEGVEIAGTHYQAPEAEHSVVQAIMHHMWAEARKQWATHIEVPAPAAVPVPAAAPPGAVVPALPGDRPPKTFPEWGPLVKRYNEVTVAGEPRDFPTNLLLGAEEVLARMYFEHTKSKEYTAVGLGEILQRRTFTAAMEVNPLAVRRHKEKGQAIRIVDGALVHDREDPWNPRGILGVIDGVEAVRWAWTLTGVATEKGAAEYAQWWTSRARQRPSQLEAITEYWDAASRRLAMQMRLRRTFEEVTAEIMKDQAAFLDILSRPRPPARQKISEGYNPPDLETDGRPGSTASPRRQPGLGPCQGKRNQRRRRDPRPVPPQNQLRGDEGGSGGRGGSGGGGWRPTWRPRGELNQQPSRQDWAEDRRWGNGDRAQSWQDRGGKRESQAQDGDRPQKQRR